MNTSAFQIPSLNSQLHELSAAVAGQLPAAAREVLDHSIELVDRSGLTERSVRVGDQAPAFTLNDARGNTVSLHDLLQNGPVVLTFYRGGWCPYCNLQLRALQAVLPQIEAAGARLVAISPQSPDESLSTQEKAELAFPVLSDANATTSRRYGLVFTVDEPTRALLSQFGADLERINGTDSWELPVPATFVIATEGTITYAFADADYRRRAEPADIVAAVAALANA